MISTAGIWPEERGPSGSLGVSTTGSQPYRERIRRRGLVVPLYPGDERAQNQQQPNKLTEKQIKKKTGAQHCHQRRFTGNHEHGGSPDPAQPRSYKAKRVEQGDEEQYQANRALLRQDIQVSIMRI